ncbi:MAG: hypothetical protein IKU23_02280 [Clostridia bacterium]|nr:hypothetical protein [Clostridia bacterium]
MKRLLSALFALLIVLSCTAVSAFATEEVKEENFVETIEDINAKLNGIYDIEGLTVTSVIIRAGSQNTLIINGVIVEENADDIAWSNEYNMSEEEYLALYEINGSAVVYDRATNHQIKIPAAEIIGKVIDASGSNLDVDFEFFGVGSEGLTRNIKYMGLGMLGIFVVVGVVILLTFTLNKITGKKQS